ncbi:hypothetical protein FB451DRAFT_1566314 [Mycena latifolia]|nr:hypothetical protein FB451DRAFT_1566314 [Mycena latifolia]
MPVDDTDEGEGEDSNDGEDVDKGQPGIRYISLKAHPVLAFEKLAQEVDWRGDEATFAIRHEYGLFMEHAISRLSNPPDDSHRARSVSPGSASGRLSLCFGLRAHALRRPGKSYYFLFRLLALGQSVFFLNAPTNVYCFSGDDVQQTNQTPRPWPETVKALRNSWVLIDIDEKTDWTPPDIFSRARARLAIDHTEIVQRLATGGPVARGLFGGIPVPTPESIENDIKTALSGNIFAFTPSGEGIQPRTDYSTEFLSAHIARTTFDLAQDHLAKVQGQLAAALDTFTTRSVAGKLVEAMMHRKAGSFVCEAAQTDIAKRSCGTWGPS